MNSRIFWKGLEAHDFPLLQQLVSQLLFLFSYCCCSAHSGCARSHRQDRVWEPCVPLQNLHTTAGGPFV